MFNLDYPEDAWSLSLKLRKTRLDLGLSQREFAVILGVNEMTIVNWELSKTKPRNMAKLEDELRRLGFC